MANFTTLLCNPLMKDIGPVVDRNPQQRNGVKLPDGVQVISADTHWEILEDIFYENFPAHLKEEAPRIWFDKYWRMGHRGQLEALGGISEAIDRVVLRGNVPGAWDMDQRIEHMNIEGVEKEIVYPQSLLAFIRLPKFEVQENMFRIYNEYIADVGRKAPGRFNGVAVCNNWWDPAKAEGAVQQIVDLGLKTMLVPVTAGKSLDGTIIHYGDPIMDRFWDVVAESGLPLTYHIGEGLDSVHRGGMGSIGLTALGSFRALFGQLVFGGVFDRHPDLKVVFAEGGISWVPPVLQDSEMLFDTYRSGDLLDKIDHRPADYWRQNCYATFQNDLLGLGQLDLIGADRVMWGSDYPHTEGCFGFGWSSMQSVVDATTPDNARKILGGTAAELYKL